MLSLLEQPSLWRNLPRAASVYLLGETMALARRDKGVSVWERAESSPIRAGRLD
jgi:hypothetical protein